MTNLHDLQRFLMKILYKGKIYFYGVWGHNDTIFLNPKIFVRGGIIRQGAQKIEYGIIFQLIYYLFTEY